MRYAHDCNQCIFLGEHHEYDLYYCKDSFYESLIARYGDDGPEYESYKYIVTNDSFADVIPWYDVAAKLVKSG